MYALAVHNGSPVLLKDASIPEIDRDSALIRPILAGICNTDLELIRGYYNYQGILGHEFVGEVVSGPAEWVGKRVVGEINLACGECDQCRMGRRSHCRSRRVLGIQEHPGVFAEYMSLPVDCLHEVPESLSDRQAVFTEPLAAALQVLDTVHIRPTDRVVVIGAGKLGLLVAQVIRLLGVDLAVVVRRERQAALLARWGISAAQLDELPAAQADVVVDCTGQQEGFADALTLLRPRGALVLKSTYHGLPTADLSAVAVQEFQVVGSRCGPFEAALRLLRSNLVDVESLIDDVYPLTEGLTALAEAGLPGTLKILLEFGR